MKSADLSGYMRLIADRLGVQDAQAETFDAGNEIGVVAYFPEHGRYKAERVAFEPGWEEEIIKRLSSWRDRYKPDAA